MSWLSDMRLSDMAERAKRAPVEQAPIIAGLALIGCGALMIQLRPHLLTLPAPQQRAPAPKDAVDDRNRVGRAAAGVRDTLLDVMPENLLTWLGRVLMLAGASVVIVRLLDQLVVSQDMTARKRRGRRR